MILKEYNSNILDIKQLNIKYTMPSCAHLCVYTVKSYSLSVPTDVFPIDDKNELFVV